MSSILDPSITERIFQGDDNAEIIARPGEPIVNIDAVAARRKVNGYIGREISSMMGGQRLHLFIIKAASCGVFPLSLRRPLMDNLVWLELWM
jgi:hypothetical protein